MEGTDLAIVSTLLLWESLSSSVLGAPGPGGEDPYIGPAPSSLSPTVSRTSKIRMTVKMGLSEEHKALSECFIKHAHRCHSWRESEGHLPHSQVVWWLRVWNDSCRLHDRSFLGVSPELAPDCDYVTHWLLTEPMWEAECPHFTDEETKAWEVPYAGGSRVGVAEAGPTDAKLRGTCPEGRTLVIA